MSTVDRVIKYLPWPIQRSLLQFRQWRADRAYRGSSPREVFSRIYRDGLWGRSARTPFFSGVGSHDDAVVTAYVAAVSAFLASYDTKPDVVDLGCGDFNVGSKLRHLCARYVACDVVAELIEHNRSVHGNLDVTFSLLDITAEDLPPGDVVFIRQVLQHLSNAQIGAVVGKLQKYPVVVVTEHVPRGEDFAPNVDKPTGPGIRIGRQPASGVVLTAPPFNLGPKCSATLCEVEYEGGVVRTIAYTMR